MTDEAYRKLDGCDPVYLSDGKVIVVVWVENYGDHRVHIKTRHGLDEGPWVDERCIYSKTKTARMQSASDEIDLLLERGFKFVDKPEWVKL